jgi:hypothetical protein
MKTTIVLAVLLAATPAFAAQYGSSYGYGQGSPGATMQDYRLAPHQRTTRQRTTRQRQPLRMQTAAPKQKSPECNMPFKKWSTNWAEYYHCYQ